MSRSSTTDPGLVPDPKNLPSPEEEQQRFIRPGSGLAILGVFVAILRGRFSHVANDDFQWIWNDDITKTKIAIESAFNEDNQYRNKRPAIFVDRDEQVLGRTVLGDLAAQSLTSGKKGFFALDTVPILIECVAAKKSESAIIGDLARVFLHASSDLIQAKFGFHEMTPVNLGRTQPYPRDKDQWVTSITFSVQYPFRWTNKPTTALLQELEMQIGASGCEDATAFFEDLVLRAPPK